MNRPLPAAELAEAIRLAGDWSALQEARIFITGGTGFFGKWLLEVLVAADRALGLKVEATVLSRDPQTFLASMPHLAQAKCLRFRPGDVLDFPFPDGPFTHILHGAASSNARNYAEDPRGMRLNLVEGTKRVMAFAACQAAPRVILISSGAVYGPQPPHLTHIPEDHPLPPDTEDPTQVYAQGKREAERIAAAVAASEGFPCPIARCFAFAGPHLPLDQHFAFGNFIRDALQGGPIRVTGDGTAIRSYLYTSELAAWLWALLLRGKSTTYNVGSDLFLSVRDLAEAIGAATGTRTQVLHKPTPGVVASRYVPRIDRIRRELGVHVQIGVDEAIVRTLRWHRS